MRKHKSRGRERIAATIAAKKASSSSSVWWQLCCQILRARRNYNGDHSNGNIFPASSGADRKACHRDSAEEDGIAAACEIFGAWDYAFVWNDAFVFDILPSAMIKSASVTENE